jgi:hypothetical protein
MRTQTVMKSKVCIICVLTVFTIAALDRIPDPPAATSHKAGVVLRQMYAMPGNLCEPRLTLGLSSPSLRSKLRWTAFPDVREVKLAADWIVSTGYAADPSPPQGESELNL